jgi:osmotically-inducible protein OsmY
MNIRQQFIHLTFMLELEPTMFLSSTHDSNAFSFGIGGSISARCAAIEAELHYLPNFSGRDISVEAEGRCVLLTGFVDTELDFFRALNVANDIAGADKVIFRVALSHGVLA